MPLPDNNIEPIPKKKPLNYTLWLISGVVGLMFAAVLALIIIGVNLITSSTKNTPVPASRPVEITQAEPLPVKRSRFATDSAILKLQQDLRVLRQDIDSTDLFESQLSAPNIDLDITIKIADNP